MKTIKEKIQRYLESKNHFTPLSETEKFLLEIISEQNDKISRLEIRLDEIESNIISEPTVMSDIELLKSSELFEQTWLKTGMNQEDIDVILKVQEDNSDEILNDDYSSMVEVDNWKLKKDEIDVALLSVVREIKPERIYMNPTIASILKEILNFGDITMLKIGTAYCIGLYKDEYPIYADSGLAWDDFCVYDKKDDVILDLKTFGLSIKDL